MRTEAVLSEICGFVGVAYSEAMLGTRPMRRSIHRPIPAGRAVEDDEARAPEVAMVEVRTARLWRAGGTQPSGYRLPTSVD